jgi:TnpA family transposase
MNGLARATFFGKQGELRERTIQHQLQRVSALNIIINAMSIWNTLHLTEAVEYQKLNVVKNGGTVLKMGLEL